MCVISKMCTCIHEHLENRKQSSLRNQLFIPLLDFHFKLSARFFSQVCKKRANSKRETGRVRNFEHRHPCRWQRHPMGDWTNALLSGQLISRVQSSKIGIFFRSHSCHLQAALYTTTIPFFPLNANDLNLA